MSFSSLVQLSNLEDQSFFGKKNLTLDKHKHDRSYCYNYDIIMTITEILSSFPLQL